MLQRPAQVSPKRKPRKMNWLRIFWILLDSGKINVVFAAVNFAKKFLTNETKGNEF